MSDNRLQGNLDEILRQKTLYLTPNNIRNGVQIFNVVGNYGGSSTVGVKLFPDVVNMQADPTAQLDDLAIVYNNISNNFEGIYKCNNSITKFNTFINDDITVDTTNNTITIIPSSTFQVDKSIIKRALLKFEETYNISGLTFGIYTPINDASTLFLGCIAYKNKDTGVFLGYYRDKADYNIYNNKNILAMWSKYSGVQQYYPVQFEYDINTDTITQSVLVPSFEESDHIGIDVTLYNCLGSFALNEDTLEFKSEFNYYPALNSAPTISTTFNNNFPVYQLVYEYAPTQFTVTAENIYNATAFGQNGSIAGTLQEITNLTKDQVVTRAQVYSDLSVLNISNVSDISNLYKSNNSIKYLPSLYSEDITNARDAFYMCSNLVSVGNINFPNCISARQLFCGCTNLTNIGSIEFNHSTTTNIRYAFSGAGITQLKNQNISDYKDIYSMFSESNLISIVDTKIGNISSSATIVFSGCNNLQRINNLYIYDLQRASGWFSNCTNLTTISNLTYNNISNLANTFFNCYHLINIDIAVMPDTLLNINNMFYNCVGLSTNSYANIANFLPTATNLSNKTIADTGLNINIFTSDQINILNAKGYTDAIPTPPTPVGPMTYYEISWT